MKTFLLFIFGIIVQENFNPCLSISGSIWNKERENFIPIFSIPQYKQFHQEILNNIRELEFRKLQNETLNFTYFEDKNFVNFINHDTAVSGLCGDLWNILSEYLNFRLNPIKSYDPKLLGLRSKNGSYNEGILGLVAQNKTHIVPKVEMYSSRFKAVDFTMPLWKNQHRLYIRLERHHDKIWLIKLYSYKIWYATIMVYIIFCLCGLLSQIISNRKDSIRKRVLPFGDHFFYNFAMICSQGFIPEELRDRSKIIELSLGLFSNVYHIAFSALIFNYISKKIFVRPFRNIDSLLKNTPYKIVVLKGSLEETAFLVKFRPIFARVVDAHRLVSAYNIHELYKKGCSLKNKYAILESQFAKRARGYYMCQLVPSSPPYFETWMASGLVKGFKYKRSIDIGIITLHELGIIDALINRWVNSKSLLEDSPIEPEPISMEQLSLVFGILISGMIASVFILMVENIPKIYKWFNSRLAKLKKT